MKHLYYPEVPMMTIQATPGELIAVGGVITEFLAQLEAIPNQTKDQLALTALLHNFQGRIVFQIQNPPQRQTPGLREVRR